MTSFQLLVLLWTLLFAHIREARGEVLFLERREGESAALPCEVEPSARPPFGVYLKRSWRSPAEVLFMYSGSDFTVARDEDRARIAVSGDPASLALNVSLSQLRAADTDRYSCEFMVENPSSEDLRLPGKTDFFLLVVGGGGGGDTGGGGAGAGECGCTGRSTLLYVLSSAVAALLLLLLLLAAVHCASRRRAVAHPQAPIYEEMAGVKPSRHGLNAGLLDQKEDSEYKNCPSKKSCPENYYETPRSALSAQRGSQE